MEKNNRLLRIVCYCLIVFLVGGCATGSTDLGKAAAPEQPAAAKAKILPAIDLPMPQREEEKAYLGVTGEGTFRMDQIKAPVVIIEVYNFYCPYCQKAAPQVNELYREIESRPEVKGKIKVIGVAFSNSPYEVESFREK